MQPIGRCMTFGEQLLGVCRRCGRVPAYSQAEGHPQPAMVITKGKVTMRPQEPKITHAALWAVDSVYRRSSHQVLAEQLSHLDRRSKTAVGVVAGVQWLHGSILLEVWFLEDRVEEDVVEEEEEEQEEEQLSASSSSQQSGPNSESRRSASAGGDHAAGVNDDAEHTGGVEQEASGASRQAARSPLSGVLLAESSPVPIVLDDVQLELHGQPQSARKGLLEIRAADIAVQLCQLKSVQKAFGPGAAPADADAAAMGVATAMAIAEEENNKRGRAGEMSTNAAFSSWRVREPCGKGRMIVGEFTDF